MHETEATGAEACPEGVLEIHPVGDVSAVLQALGDPMRLAIVRLLAATGGERTCGSFGLPITKSTASHHFRVLREAGITAHRIEGTRRFLSLRRGELDAAYPGLLDSILRAAIPESLPV
ncbi:MAG TPA: metalloregulator ArsR/SmtB family transcription factor [Candidatus Dormibacteraeota bacterium]|nr:metalloregulator ArsR/SmtB family transcription factor [Candidatus Dormibacteraeota bacterium]